MTKELYILEDQEHLQHFLDCLEEKLQNRVRVVVELKNKKTGQV